MSVIERPKDKLSNEPHNVKFGSVTPEIKGLKDRQYKENRFSGPGV